MEFMILILIFPDTWTRWECSTFSQATGLPPSELPFYIITFFLLGWFSYLLVRQTGTFPLKSCFPRSYLVTGGALCSPYIWFVIGFKILSFLFKSLFCLGFIFQYEVLLIYSSLISLPYHVGLLGLIYDPTVSYNLHGFAGLFHPLDIPLLYQTAQSSCISKVSPDLSSDNMFLKALDCCFPMNSRKLTEVKKQKTQRSV